MRYMNREAVVLAGGLGTRLKDVVEELPKSMAPVNNKPFLAYILDKLSSSGFTTIILATGYKTEVIERYFGDEWKGAKLIYSIEKEPLGTGGAILHALPHITSENCFVFNGDTLFTIDFGEMQKEFLDKNPVMTIALKRMSDFDRYGSVTMEGDRIVSFNEKRFIHEGLINGGIYILDRKWFEQNAPGDKFSFEKDIMEINTRRCLITGYISDAYFIDIGIPDDYYRALSDLKG
jgi:D-glycero-alpha-D-manno-heptose 1-phosphate guanylyltransferase